MFVLKTCLSLTLFQLLLQKVFFSSAFHDLLLYYSWRHGIRPPAQNLCNWSKARGGGAVVRIYATDAAFVNVNVQNPEPENVNWHVMGPNGCSRRAMKN